ncbi:hypothetical protein [Paenibacillus odorifer]|uniref:hypothetical protein n=1 Tax=Paenibacillus odorifer TaxID=189426 RepID=UPI00096FD953|nr:hypothetical protein [Paenibacillus odorifer]OMD66671.1 hypothetical protein BSK50_30690 [Paenibacillus odorifer]
MGFVGCLFTFILIIIIIAAFGSSISAGITTLIIIAAVYFLIVRYTNKKEKEVLEQAESDKEALTYMLEKLHTYVPHQKFITPDNDLILSFDENSKRINFTSKYNNELYDFDKIIVSEVIINEVSVSKTDRSSQIGGALIGGALLGGVGAAIGGLSGDIKAEGKVKRIQLKITINDIQNPNHYVTFFQSAVEVDKDNPTVKSALEQVSKWNSIISILIKREIEEKAENAQVANTKQEEQRGSVADELLKLSELLKQDFISKEEFDLQKAKLLSK